ncbi:MAG: ATP-binding protein [Armatimonadetes bacterium]|nr:ATP-binding protein [Armatimonadota bacterium]
MDDQPLCHHEFPILGSAYFLGGRASTSVKRVLSEAGVDGETIQRVSVACYEAEMNVVLHAISGYIALDVFADRVEVSVKDRGPGIEDIELAMTPGWSSATEEARALGFGAGMGLPNIKGQADEMEIESPPGEGVRMKLVFRRGDRGDD